MKVKQNTKTTKSAVAVKEERKELLKIYSFLIIPILGFLVFSIYPIAWNFITSFTEYDKITMKFVGLDQYIRIFTKDKIYWETVVNSFIIGFGKLIIELPLSLILSYVLTRGIRGESVFKTAFMIPTVIGGSVIAMIFSMMFSVNNGFINTTLMKIGAISEPLNWFGEKWLAVLMLWITSIWQNFGTNMLYFMTGIVNVPKELYESARIDGANALKEFRYITLPCIAPLTKVVIMLAIMGAIRDYELPMLMTNGGPVNGTNVVMLYIYKYFFKTSEVSSYIDYGYSAAMGMVTSVIVLIVTLLYLRMNKSENN